MVDIVDEHHQPKRAEDFSILTKVGSFFLKYNWLFALIVGLLIEAGFGWRTPQSRFEELSAQIRANRNITQSSLDTLRARADRTDVNNQRVVDILDLFSVDLCLRRRADPYIYRRLKCLQVLGQEVPQ